MADPLSADSLLERARTLAGNHDTATLKSPVQALALLSYAIHSQLDFRCLDQLDDDWIDKEGSNFKFKYRHDQSSLEFVVSIQDLAPSPRLLVAAAAHANDADARSSTLDISIRDYFSPSAFPCKVSDLSDQNPFAATHRFKDLVALYRINIVQKLLPGLNKSGYHELVDNAARSPPLAAGSGTTYLPDAGGPMGMFPPPRGGGGGGGAAPSPAPPLPGPVPDDPLRIPGSGGGGGGNFPIADIGRRDLDPLGGMGGTFGGPAGFGRLPGGFGGDNGGAGGMYMGPDHPLFRERFGPDADTVTGGGRRWGGDGYLPPIGAPPGARFDPVGPSVRPVPFLSLSLEKVAPPSFFPFLPIPPHFERRNSLCILLFAEKKGSAAETDSISLSLSPIPPRGSVERPTRRRYRRSSQLSDRNRKRDWGS